MGEFTREERNKIARNPLGRSSEVARAIYHLGIGSGTLEDPKRPALVTQVMTDLLEILTESNVATSLTSRTGGESLASEFAEARKRTLGYHKHLHLLLQLVIKQADDIDIWDAIIDGVQAILTSTSPSSPRPPIDQAAMTPSSASEGTEADRRQVKARVLKEIYYSTYRGVDGFHAKYFEGKS